MINGEDGILHTFPLAGTRPRGKTEAEDKELETELLADEKELAKHNMLVDLGRNDFGKISKFGSVQVEKLHSIERFSHVMHIGSTVRGEIREEFDGLDAIEAVLPAGTLSGAPKIRACQLIAELDTKCPLFKGCSKRTLVARYHSLAADADTMPEELLVTAKITDGEIMAVRHKEYPIFGVQFHPESILTPEGRGMLYHFINNKATDLTAGKEQEND